METKVTLEDVINLPMDQLMNKINNVNLPESRNKAPTEAQMNELVVEEQVISEEVQIGGDITTLDKFNLGSLKGHFASGTTFNKGDSFQVGDYHITVIGTIPSANRVKFKVDETGTTHSMPVSILTGVECSFPYKKGDKVMFNGVECEVKRINPANANVVIWHEDKYKYVKITKVTPV